MLSEKHNRKVRFIGHIKCYLLIRTKKRDSERKVIFMKGYNVESGYMGYVEDRYMLFASEEDYMDYISSSSMR